MESLHTITEWLMKPSVLFALLNVIIVAIVFTSSRGVGHGDENAAPIRRMLSRSFSKKQSSRSDNSHMYQYEQSSRSDNSQIYQYEDTHEVHESMGEIEERAGDYGEAVEENRDDNFIEGKVENRINLGTSSPRSESKRSRVRERSTRSNDIAYGEILTQVKQGGSATAEKQHEDIARDVTKESVSVKVNRESKGLRSKSDKAPLPPKRNLPTVKSGKMPGRVHVSDHMTKSSSVPYKLGRDDTQADVDFLPPPPPLIKRSGSFLMRLVSFGRSSGDSQSGSEEAPYTDEVDAEAENFIRGFRKQLQLQRYESLERAGNDG